LVIFLANPPVKKYQQKVETPDKIRPGGNPMSEYIYLIHPFRHEFFDQPTLEEDVVTARRWSPTPPRF
jgi:hypothetical protein